MADLVRGRYPVTSPIWSLVGQLANTTQSDIAARSNGVALGLAGLADTAAALTTQVCTAVAVPVEYGDVISSVTVLVGATAAGTPTNQFAALYSGVATTPALMAQSTDGLLLHAYICICAVAFHEAFRHLPIEPASGSYETGCSVF